MRERGIHIYGIFEVYNNFPSLIIERMDFLNFLDTRPPRLPQKKNRKDLMAWFLPLIISCHKSVRGMKFFFFLLSN